MSGGLAEITSRLRANKEELFEALLRETYTKAFHLALRLVGHTADAEDLVQETYLRAYRFFHRYDPQLPFTNWLYKIMTNTHIDQMRRKGKVKTISLDETHPETGAVMDFPDTALTPEELVLSREFEADIQDALNQMTPEFRIAVLLADLEGLSYEEVSEIMGTSIGTVRSRIHRGRKQLRDFLVKRNPARYGARSEQAWEGAENSDAGGDGS